MADDIGTAPRPIRIAYGVLDLVTAAAVAFLARILWSGSSWWPAALWLWFGLLVLSAIGLFHGGRWGRFMARLASFYQLGFLAVLIGGFVASVTYLWGLYGEVGTGIAALFLLILAVLLEVMGLLPIFKLRAIGVLEHQSQRLARTGLGGAALVTIIGVASCFAIYARASYDPWEPLPYEAKAALSGGVLAVLRDEPSRLASAYPELSAHWVVRVYRQGRLEARIEAHGDAQDVLDAVGDRYQGTMRSGRIGIVIDRVVGETSIETGVPLLAALSVVPGLDGITGEVDGTRAAITPQELLLSRMLTAQTPIRFVPDFKAGVNLEQAKRRLCQHAGRKQDCEVTTLRRARTESWARYRGETFELYRGRPAETHSPTASKARSGALSAGQYVLRAQQGDGRFVYKYFPQTGKKSIEPYDIPRHAGTTWFLLQLADRTQKPSVLRAAEKSLDWLEAQLRPCGSGSLCLPSGDTASLGVQALPLIAFATHANSTGSDRYASTIHQLAQVVLGLQKDDGDFDFTRDAHTGRPLPGPRAFYAAGQAALALALAGEATGNPRYLDASRRALDFMSGPYWSFFASDLFFIEEHWTCLAADEVHRLFEDPRHAELCLEIASFYRHLQHRKGATGFPDYVGGVGFSPFFPPHTTPTASRAEALIAAYRISERLGRPDAALRQGIEDAVGFLLHNQYQARDTYPFQSNLAVGGVPWNYLDPMIRVDTVQHAGTVMLHGVSVLEPSGASSALSP
ncbi:MAG: hypothetical protein PVI24_09555 [Myxococcales bacterium]